MAIKNEIDVNKSDSVFLDTRDIKANAEGIKVRLFGDQVMGYAYYQNAQEDGKDVIKNVKSKDYPKMENPTDNFKGETQKPSKNLYSVVWDYDAERPAVLTLDKVSVISELLNVEKDKDLKSMTDYDFKITFDANEVPASKYKVVRLDATDLTKEQLKELKAFTKGVTLEEFADGGNALVSDNDDTSDIAKEF